MLVGTVRVLVYELVYQYVNEPVTLVPLRFIQEFFAAAHEEAEARPVVIGKVVLSSTVVFCRITEVDLIWIVVVLPRGCTLARAVAAAKAKSRIASMATMLADARKQRVALGQ